MSSNTCLGMLIAAGMTAGIAGQSCDASGHRTHVSVVDRATAIKAENPDALVVGIDTNGKLTLNQIDLGTIRDPRVLNEKLEAVFEERRRSSIDQTEILIELSGQVEFDDVTALIASIRPLRPTRIKVMTK